MHIPLRCMQESRPRLHHLSPPQLSRLAWALAVFRFRPDAAWLERLAEVVATAAATATASIGGTSGVGAEADGSPHANGATLLPGVGAPAGYDASGEATAVATMGSRRRGQSLGGGGGRAVGGSSSSGGQAPSIVPRAVLLAGSSAATALSDDQLVVLLWSLQRLGWRPHKEWVVQALEARVAAAEKAARAAVAEGGGRG